MTLNDQKIRSGENKHSYESEAYERNICLPLRLVEKKENEA